MKISHSKKDSWLTMVVRGDVDDFTYPTFAKEMNVLHRLGSKKLYVDLSKSRFINISAIRLMASKARDFNREGKELVFSMPEGESKELLIHMCDVEVSFYDQEVVS